MKAKLHQSLSSVELAQLLSLDPGLLQAGMIIPGTKKWRALLNLGEFQNDPTTATVDFGAWLEQRKSHRWWRRFWTEIASASKPCAEWELFVADGTQSWISLGSAKCNSWTVDEDRSPKIADLVLEHRVPRDLFHKARDGKPWIWLTSTITEAAFQPMERVKALISQENGKCSVSRWEGDVFVLQFDAQRSIFYISDDSNSHSTFRFASCSAAVFLSCEISPVFDIECPCCEVVVGSVNEMVMTRDFGFFVLKHLLNDGSLPSSYQNSKGTLAEIDWVELPI